MRSTSPYPFRYMRNQRSRSRSLSSNYGTSPGGPRPYSDTSFIHQDIRTVSQFPQRSTSTRPASRSRLTSLIEQSLDCGETATTTTTDSSGDESKSLLGSEDAVTAVYSRRWYLLLVFSSVALLQTMSWAVWGPISESAEAVLGWDDSNITMCLFLGNLTFCVCCIPFSWLMDRKGFRLCVVLTSFAIMAGSGLRCLIHFVPSDYHTWCIYGGQLLNGIAGPVAQGGGALFSTLWFPNNQRASSTAVSTFIGYTGSALAFVLGPMLVPSPSDNPNNNSTLPDGNNSSMPVKQAIFTALGSSNSSSDTTSDASAMKDAILQYMDYMAVASVVVFLMVVVYFPDKPPRPPSLSAASEREDFIPGITKLMKNKQFWLICLAFCMSLGVFEVWDVVLDVNLSTIGISQETAGWMGFYCVLAGCGAGLIICRLGDIFFRQIRLFLLVSYVVSAVFVLWFILIYIGVLPFDITSIYAAIILSGVFLDGCSPLVYELVCEAAYPVSEGVSSCFLQMVFVLVGMAFAAVQNVPNIGTEWMNWCLLGTLCAAIPLLLCVTDVYGRADIDDLEDEITVVNTPENPSMQNDGWRGEKEPLLNPRASPGNILCPSLSPSPSLLSPLSPFPPRSRPGYGACSCPPELVFIPGATGTASERGRTRKVEETETGKDGDWDFKERETDTDKPVPRETDIDGEERRTTEIDDTLRDRDSVAGFGVETEQSTGHEGLEAAYLRTIGIDRDAKRDRDTMVACQRTETETGTGQDRRTKKTSYPDRKKLTDSDSSCKETIRFANGKVNFDPHNDDLETHPSYQGDSAHENVGFESHSSNEGSSAYRNGFTSHSSYQGSSARGNVGLESSLGDQSFSLGLSWSSRDASLPMESESCGVGCVTGHRPGSGGRYSSSPTSASDETGSLLTSSRSPDLSFLRMELGGT